VATFAGCHIDVANTYTLTASDGGLTTAASDNVVVSVGAATMLAFTTQPGAGTGGVALVQQPVVKVQDAGGNTITGNTSNVTLSIATGGAGGLSCTGTTTKTAVAGVATFAGCTINTAATYTLTASNGVQTDATSGNVVISVGAASMLAFTTQPGAGTGGVALATQPVVKVQDAGGNTVTGNTSSVTLTIATGGAGGLSCTGTTTKVAVAGVATFVGCTINTAATYTLTASNAVQTDATSGSVVIAVGVASKLAFTTEMAASTGGIVSGIQPVVTIQDAGANRITGNTSTVTLSIATGGAGGLSCTGGNAKVAVAGRATFVGCKINLAATYTLTGSNGAQTNATSGNVVITAGVGASLAFTTQPGGSTGGTNLATQPVVKVHDAGGNVATGDVSSVVLTLTTPGSAALTCTGSTTKVAVAGVATYAGCKIDLANTYTLTATDGALTTDVSDNVVITVGAASKLAFTTQPSGAVSDTDFATQPVVKVQDAGGNTIVGNTSNVTLTIATGGAGGLACTTNPVAAVAGVATFAGCDINLVGTYTLLASNAVQTDATSGSVVITVGVASKVAFTTQPTDEFAVQPVVKVQDASGNTITTDSSSSVMLTIATGGAGNLTCTPNPKIAASGIATFSGCAMANAGTYTLTATVAGLATATSNSFSATGF
jgi:hypothetical protein